jgi:hypothetical protein
MAMRKWTDGFDSLNSLQRTLTSGQKCGQQFFGDVKEYRADGIKELIEKMSRSTGAKVTVVPYNKTSNSQHWVLKAPSWLQKFTRTSNTGQKRALGSTGCLPQHNTPNQSSSSTSSTLAPSTTAPTKPKLHLLACTHRTQRQKCLLQDSIDGVSTDQALFCFMKQQLQHSRSRIRSILSMRSVQGMFFVKVSVKLRYSFAKSDDAIVSPSYEQHSRSARSQPMLRLEQCKHLRVHTSSTKSRAISNRRVSLHPSRPSGNMATSPISRPDAHALLTTMHQRAGDLGAGSAPQADGRRAPSMRRSASGRMGNLLSGGDRFRYDHWCGIRCFHPGQFAFRHLVDEARDGHPRRFRRKFVHGDCKWDIPSLDGKSSQELGVGSVDLEERSLPNSQDDLIPRSFLPIPSLIIQHTI